MKQHERERFVSSIRSGVFFYRTRGIVLKVFSPTIDDEVQLSEVYHQAYSEAFEEGVMTEDEMLSWQMEKGLWSEEEEARISGLESDLERLKVEIYENRHNYELVDQIRVGIRKGEEQLQDHKIKKSQFVGNTCEGMAGIEKAREQIRLTTFLNDALYDFNLVDIDEILSVYNASFLDEKLIRDLTINNPWKIHWYMRETQGFKLFANRGRELTPDQKNIVIWSRMYDSVNESMDSPSERVIKDQDMLDGWFVIQKEKREKERSNKEFDEEHAHTKGADEVFVVTKDARNTRRVKNMNDASAKMIIRQREAQLKSRGTLQQGDFHDVQLEKRGAQNQMYKDKFRR